MSQETKRYYWLKLKDNFFEREEIQLIESLPNGKEYILLLLKLMMLSINSEGRLVVKNLFPYNPQMLATITHTNIDTVRSAIDVFIKFGLMSTLDDGTLYMNEVQALLGSETEFAAKKREYRQNIKNQPKQLIANSNTQIDIVQDNVRQENRVQRLDTKGNTPLPPKGENGGGSVWLQIAKNLNLVFTSDEQSEIMLWAKHLGDKKSKITVLQIETNLQTLAKLKADGYDICKMIIASVSAGYGRLAYPEPCFLVTHSSIGNSSTRKPHAYRYDNPEYIIPESKADKFELRNYLERCYMRDMVDPRTKQALTNDQKRIFKAHYDYSKSKHIGITEYIFQNEVLSGVCLLEQIIDDGSTSSKQSVA